ncbi:hypothetical protein ACJ6WF_42670 [Streptomyces sp. MMS24-I2-30]|uniref:hypothetical protein n=1 Tax=Streptomyces sp. MMS24-I2-30 TaxID=3351564 RepID=UPI003896A98A
MAGGDRGGVVGGPERDGISATHRRLGVELPGPAHALSCGPASRLLVIGVLGDVRVAQWVQAAA